MTARVTVSARGAARLRHGHPWVYRSDVETGMPTPGIVDVVDRRHRFLGRALWSPASEIRLRLLTRADVPIEAGWWVERLERALARRRTLPPDVTAHRVVHAEGDGLPSLVVDRYGEYVVAQLLSAGLETVRGDVLAAIREVLRPAGVLLRHDASVRRHEGLPLEIVEAWGSVPEVVEVSDGTVRFAVPLRTGQKTGAFLDQRENRRLIGERCTGQALDLFTYHGLFALHLAARAETVLAADSSAAALEAARANARLNGRANVEWIEADVFDLLRQLEESGRRFDTIVLDPPAFAKRRESLDRAVAGYKQVNLRAMRLLAPGGLLLTCSCSFHLSRALFLDMLAAAAADSGRTVALERIVGQSGDHPEVVTIPETGYLKGALLRAVD